MEKEKEIFDFIIIGSGFGGSVSAMRLCQKGYKVAMVEMGRDYSKVKYPKTNWDVKNYLWAPLFRCFGIQKITLLKKLMVLHGVGVGGGSLVYANTLLRPPEKIFKTGSWPKNIDWFQELSPFYKLAQKMLGVTTNKSMFDGEKAIKQLSIDLGKEETFHPSEVGVYFGDSNKLNPDPYFNGEGPSRHGCNFCGACMIGCPNGSKNTLDKNYLYFARKWGLKIFAQSLCEKISPFNNIGFSGYKVHTKSSTSIFKKEKVLICKKVIVSAGALGTLKLLFKNKFDYKTLPNISNQLGETVRSNGESLLGVTSLKGDKDFSKGIAIGAQFKSDSHTKIEGVRYPKGSSFMKMLAVPLTDNGNFITRPFKLALNFIKNFATTIKLFFLQDWATNSIILLVMQSYETKIKINYGRSLFTGFTKGLKGDAEGEGIKSFMPEAQHAAKMLAKNIDGVAQNCISEVGLQTPATAHILGGAIIGDDDKNGVIDQNHQVFGYKGLYICDASVIPSNLEVNPSLTITALAERFASQFTPIKQPHKIQFTDK